MSPTLVSGANGHLGRRLLSRIGSGDARALVRSERAAASARPLASDVVVASYSDAGAIEGACAGCDRLVHLVGILKETATARYADAHETATTVLARAAAAAGIKRIVYLSILGSEPASRNPCLASKGRAEEILLQCAVPSTVIRVPMVLGQGDDASAALRAQASARVLPLIRGGASLEQPICADDVIDAILAALDSASLEGEAIDLAGPECLSHRDLVLRAAAILGTSPRIVPVPLWPIRFAARVMKRILADPPLTPAMLGVLEHDDRVEAAAAAARLGIDLTSLDETLRRCLS